jgi:hypothetical protein
MASARIVLRQQLTLTGACRLLLYSNSPQRLPISASHPAILLPAGRLEPARLSPASPRGHEAAFRGGKPVTPQHPCWVALIGDWCGYWVSAPDYEPGVSRGWDVTEQARLRRLFIPNLLTKFAAFQDPTFCQNAWTGRHSLPTTIHWAAVPFRGQRQIGASSRSYSSVAGHSKLLPRRDKGKCRPSRLRVDGLHTPSGGQLS